MAYGELSSVICPYQYDSVVLVDILIALPMIAVFCLTN